MKSLITICLLLISGNLYAQITDATCEKMYRAADSLFGKANYSLAVKKLSAYKICAGAAQNKKADDLLLRIYDTVNSQRRRAEQAEIMAKKQADTARMEALRARIEQKTAVASFNAVSDATLGYKSAEEAYLLYPDVNNTTGYAALLRSYYGSVPFYKTFDGHTGHIQAIRFSPAQPLLISLLMK